MSSVENEMPKVGDEIGVWVARHEPCTVVRIEPATKDDEDDRVFVEFEGEEYEAFLDFETWTLDV